MIAGPGKPDAISLNAGHGRVRARTITIGGYMIAIANIATVRIVRGQRSWWLFVIGILIIGAAATQLNTYGAIAISGIALGLALMVGDLAQKVQRGLLIGTNDAQSLLIVSRDEIFLQRLLQLFVDKIDSADETLLATFDIGHNTISAVTAPADAHDDALLDQIVAAPPHPVREPEPPRPSPHTAPPPLIEPEPEPEPVAVPPVIEDTDDSLFADAEPANDDAPDDSPIPEPEVVAMPEPAPEPAPQPPPQIVRRAAAAEHRPVLDPLFDAPPKRSSDDDWLTDRCKAPPPPLPEPDGAVARVMLAFLIIVLLGAGVFAAWYFTGETGATTSVTQIVSPSGEETAAD